MILSARALYWQHHQLVTVLEMQILRLTLQLDKNAGGGVQQCGFYQTLQMILMQFENFHSRSGKKIFCLFNKGQGGKYFSLWSLPGMCLNYSATVHSSSIENAQITGSGVIIFMKTGIRPIGCGSEIPYK